MVNEKGQTLVEWLIVSLLLFFVFFAIIEVIRLQSFKAYLQDMVNYYANYISLYQYKFIEGEKFSINSENKKLIDSKIKKLIQNEFLDFKTSLLSFDDEIKYINENNIFLKFDPIFTPLNHSDAPGVYLDVATCLPVLFTGILNRFNQELNLNIGKKVNGADNKKDCLGMFTDSNHNPHFSFKIRVAAFAPWPASTQIYLHGLAVPLNQKMINQELSQSLEEKLSKSNISPYMRSKNEK